MKTLSRKTLTLLVAASLASPLTLFAADKATEDHAVHHPEQAPTAKAPGKPMPGMQQMQDRMQAMQARMDAMQKTADPQTRMPLMMEQMKDMQAMMKDMRAGCPMAGGMGGKGGMGMMGGGMMGGGTPGAPMPMK